MAAYRFCRSDDVPLLVQAWNACYRVHFPDLPELTVEAFKRQIRERQLWTSSCMVAFSGDDPIGVLLAAKRETESLICAVGVQPDHAGRGHGRHLMESLAQKLAILGPRRMLAELPPEPAGPCRFLERCGYTLETTLTDFVLDASPPGSPSAAMIDAVGLDELAAAGAFPPRGRRCWDRGAEALERRKETLGGLAIASHEQIEAWLLYHEPDPEGAREIVAFDCAVAERAAALLGTLFRHYGARDERTVRVSRVDPGELSFDLLERWGFRPAGQTLLYAMEAREKA